MDDRVARAGLGVLVTCVLIAVLAVSGCGVATPEVEPGANAPAAQQTAPATDGQADGAGSAVPIVALTPSEKRAVIGDSFPAEVPVPSGDFARAQAQGPDAWDYEVDVRGSVQELTDWFNAAYSSRQWSLTDSGELTGSSLGTFLVFRKGQAESRIDVEESDVDGFATARVVVGVGAPVLQTQ